MVLHGGDEPEAEKVTNCPFDAELGSGNHESQVIDAARNAAATVLNRQLQPSASERRKRHRVALGEALIPGNLR